MSTGGLKAFRLLAERGRKGSSNSPKPRPILARSRERTFHVKREGLRPARATIVAAAWVLSVTAPTLSWRFSLRSAPWSVWPAIVGGVSVAFSGLWVMFKHFGAGDRRPRTPARPSAPGIRPRRHRRRPRHLAIRRRPAAPPRPRPRGARHAPARARADPRPRRHHHQQRDRRWPHRRQHHHHRRARAATGEVTCRTADASRSRWRSRRAGGPAPPKACSPATASPARSSPATLGQHGDGAACRRTRCSVSCDGWSRRTPPIATRRCA